MTKTLTKILIIADLPRYDRSSAGFRFYHMVKIISQCCKVSFCALDYFDQILLKDIDTVRYKKKIEELGVDVTKGGLVQTLLDNKFDAIFFEYYFVAEHYLPLASGLQPHARLFVDSVDVHFHRLLSKAHLTQSAADYEAALSEKKREVTIYDSADVIVTVTENDKAVLLKENANYRVEIIPNIHPVVNGEPSRQREGTELIFIGTFHHEPNIDAMLYFAHEIWPIVMKRIPHAKLKIVGNAPTAEILALKSDSIEVTGFVEDTLPYLKGSTISIAPLRFGAGMKGKIGEAMAAGLPVVTTTVGIEGMGLTDGENILVADEPQVFAECICSLIEDKELYDKIVSNGLRFIRDSYSEEAVRARVEHIFSDVTIYAIVHQRKWFSPLLKLRHGTQLSLERRLLWRFRRAGLA